MSYWDNDNHDLDYEQDRYYAYRGGTPYNESSDQYNDSEIMEQFENMLYMLDVKPDDSDFYIPTEAYQDIVDTYNALGRYWYRSNHDYEREYPDGRTPEEYIDDLYDTTLDFQLFLDELISDAPELASRFNFKHIRDITKELASQIAYDERE